MADDVDARVKKEDKIPIHAYSMPDGFTYMGKKKGGTSGRFNELVNLEDAVIVYTVNILSRLHSQNFKDLGSYYKKKTAKGKGITGPIPINTLQAIAIYPFFIEK